MKTGTTGDQSVRSSAQEQARIRRGLQCPECFGVQIETRRNRFDARPDGWLCTECGCHWSQPVNVGDALHQILGEAIAKATGAAQ